jgi:hypothetical protein
LKDFTFIHPTIIDLYCNYLILDDLQDALGKVNPSNFTSNIKKEVEIAANQYSISLTVAEKALGSLEMVKAQMYAFSHSTREA